MMTIIGLLIMVTIVSVGFIASPFGGEVEAATALNNTKSAVAPGNTTVTLGRANMSATFPLMVLFPEANQFSSFDYTITSDKKLQIEVLFSKPVDTATVIPGTSLILAMETNSNAPTTVSWALNNRFLTMVTNDEISALCIFDPDCFFSLRLDGIEPNSIKGEDGSLLNGGFNDYWTGFADIG
jgi:hypothetical protein